MKYGDAIGPAAHDTARPRHGKRVYPAVFAGIAALAVLGFAAPAFAVSEHEKQHHKNMAKKLTKGMSWHGPNTKGDMKHGMKMEAMQNSPRVHTVHMVGELHSMAQHMVMEFLQVALEIDPKSKLKALRKTQARFNAILSGLRNGDDRLGLKAAKERKEIAALDRAQIEWSGLERLANDIFKQRKVTPDHVARIAGSKDSLFSALAGLSGVFEYGASNGRSYSVLLSTVTAASRNHALVHQMLTHCLLLANGFRPVDRQALLSDTYHEFDTSLNGLISGDPNRKIIAPPDPKIEKQYLAAQNVWKKLMPAIKAAAETGMLDRRTLTAVVTQGIALSSELQKAVVLYHAL